MEVIRTHGFEHEAVLSLKHVHVVSKVIAPEMDNVSSNMTSSGCITCYITDTEMMSRVQNWFRVDNPYVSLAS